MLSCLLPSSILLTKKEGTTFGVIRGAPITSFDWKPKRVLLCYFIPGFISSLSQQEMIEQQSWFFPQSILCGLPPHPRRSTPWFWYKHRSSIFLSRLDCLNSSIKYRCRNYFLSSPSSPIKKIPPILKSKMCFYVLGWIPSVWILHEAVALSNAVAIKNKYFYLFCSYRIGPIGTLCIAFLKGVGRLKILSTFGLIFWRWIFLKCHIDGQKFDFRFQFNKITDLKY